MASKVKVDGRVRVNNTHVEQNDTALTICFTRYLEEVRRRRKYYICAPAPVQRWVQVPVCWWRTLATHWCVSTPEGK